MTATEMNKDNDFLNKGISNESSITICSSSIEDKCYSDAESSSLDTIDTQQDKDVEEAKIRRNRSATITKSNSERMLSETVKEGLINEEEEKGGDNNTKELVYGLQQMEESQYSDSENSTEDVRYHTRNQSYRSTMSSIHSYMSSASNYDLLLARLDNNNNNAAFYNNSTEELRKSFEKDNLSEEIDWGKSDTTSSNVFCVCTYD